MSNISAVIRAGLPETFGPREAALVIGAFSVVAISAALALEHIGGLRPCHLCLEQRVPYYAAIPLALAAFLLARPAPAVTRALLALIALAFVYNTGLGVYHSGVEWGWWPGPDTCTGLGTIASSPQELMKSLARGGGVVVRCDEVPLRILGLSLAGYGALLSAFLAALAGAGALGIDLAARLRSLLLPGAGGVGQEIR
jgi:disulfide bond formation protein DsbB